MNRFFIFRNTFLVFLFLSAHLFSQRNCAPPHIYFGLTSKLTQKPLTPDSIKLFLKGKAYVNYPLRRTFLDKLKRKIRYAYKYNDTAYFKTVTICKIDESVLCHSKAEQLMFYALLKDKIKQLELCRIDIFFKNNCMRLTLNFAGMEGRNANEDCKDCFIYYEQDYKKILQQDINEQDIINFDPGKEYVYSYSKPSTSLLYGWQREVKTMPAE